jgi:hypothetical protein
MRLALDGLLDTGAVVAGALRECPVTAPGPGERGCEACRVVGPLLTGPGTSGRSWRCDTCGEVWSHPVPAPLDQEPRSVRPPFDVRDDRWDHLRVTDPDAARRAVHLDRVAALLEPLDGIALSDRERAALEWLTGFDVPTVAPLVRLLWAARQAAPLAQ